MSQRSKNLLEAFNQSKAPEKSAEPVAQPRGSAPRVGGPFADSAPAARSSAQPNLYDARSGTEAPPSARQRWRVVFLSTGIAVIFFFVGRASAPGVQAAGPSSTPPAGTASIAAPPATAPLKQALGNDAALMDPKNQYTLLAITYNKFDDATEKLAAATKARLIGMELPASISRNREKERIYVLVGAAPKTSDLDPLLARLKEATSDRNKKDFSTAHSARISDYVVR